MATGIGAPIGTRLLVLAAATGLLMAGAARLAPTAAHPAAVSGYTLDDIWPVEDDNADPVAVAVRPSGVSYTVNVPLRPEAGFGALVRREPDGTVTGRQAVIVPGPEPRLLSVAVTRSGELFAATDDTLLALEPDGAVRWTAPAGDGHPDFGPAARGLAAGPDGLYGADLANGRVLGYDGATGARRLRLGTVGTGPGSYRSPMDVAVDADGAITVADFGNRRLQRLDRYGNPLAQWPLPGRPRALDRDADGRTFVLLDTDEVRVLDASGTPLLRFGGDAVLHMATDLAVAPDGRVLVVDRGHRRIVVFRPVDGPVPTAPAGPGSATPTASPEPMQRLDLLACPGSPARLDLDVPLPAAPPRADVMLVFDTTGSMESVISTAQRRALELAEALSAGASSDVAIGVMDVRDYPYGEAGLASDWPWHLRGPLSTDPDDLARATALLRAGGGGDAPEAYAGALVAALDHSRAGWRPDARRFLVVLGDSVPRDDDLNAGITDPHVPGRWSPGVPSWWRDSGPDWAPGTADDLDWGAVLDRLASEDVTLLVALSGAAPEALSGRVGQLADYWAAWAERAGPGGTAVDMLEVGRLPEVVGALMAGAGRRIGRLEGRAGPPAYAQWVTFTPREFTDLTVPDGGLSRTFAVTIEPGASTPYGRYELSLSAVGDGAQYARLDIGLAWRPTCDPTSTPDAVEPTSTPRPTEPPTATRTATPSPTVSPTVTASRTAVPTATATATRRPPSPAYLPILMRRYCAPGVRPKADIILVLDTSSSMAGSKLDAALDAAVSFVSLLNLPRDHAAIVTFDDQARVAAGLTGSRATLLVALAEADTSLGTRIDRGLEAALAELAGPAARSDASPVVVLMTDGRPAGGTEGAVLAAAERARGAGVTVFTIGLGDDVDGDLLTRVAGDPTRYYYAPDAADLEAIYQRIAVGIPCE